MEHENKVLTVMLALKGLKDLFGMNWLMITRSLEGNGIVFG